MPVFPVLTIFPMTATVIAGAFAAILLNRYFASRRRVHELMWGIAFMLFALGAGCQVLAEVGDGWNPLLGQLFYLSGAILNVGFLGVGTLYLVANRKVARVGLLIMVALTVVGTLAVFTAPVDAARLSDDAGWRAVATLSPWPRVLAIISNTLGTILVVGGALWSAAIFWRKRTMKTRMMGVLLLAAGTLVVAFGGTITGATGLKDHDYHYFSMSLGVIVMFAGYLQTIRPEVAPARIQPQVEQQSTPELA